VSEWNHISTAPKDGQEILICIPGGHSDSYYVVCWEPENEPPCWQSRDGNTTLTVNSIERCYLQPMWMELPIPPSSLCAGPGIKSDSPKRYDLEPPAEPQGGQGE